MPATVSVPEYLEGLVKVQDALAGCDQARLNLKALDARRMAENPR
jgi:hypothetical protein